jgi:hypothetical protein
MFQFVRMLISLMVIAGAARLDVARSAAPTQAPMHRLAHPERIPGYQGLANEAPGTEPNCTYVHVRIGQTTIYFPNNGMQPTTVQAALWSDANVRDEDITTWYMRVFGWILEDNTGIVNNDDRRRCKLGPSYCSECACPIIMLLRSGPDRSF